jgi:U3 small nucleolar RNA-associated protein 14
MPGRQSHGAPPSKKSKVRNNAKKRSMNAFSIASHENPETLKIRQHRLGAQEGRNGNRPGKRRRDEEDDEDEEEEAEPKRQRKGPAKGRFDELDMDHGSDSEGNEWKLGQVDSDDDSDLDSDEAFGESDEERFDGFAFSGSSDKKLKKSQPRHKDVNLDEDDGNSESDPELEESDLGEDAVDLATMLDMAEEEEEEERRGNSKAQEEEGSESESEEDSENDVESSLSSADEDEDDDETADPARIAALQNMIANLPQADEVSRPSKQRSDGASEYATPSDYGLTSKTKLTLEDLGLPAINDPHIKKSLKFIEADAKGKKKGVTAKLEVPLAKRQQDRLDRSAAYEKSKETLNRWTDTVAHNRRADHLMFPLPDLDMAAVKKNDKLVPTNQTKPFNELEATIQSILEESGLATANGKDDEDQIREYEELETKKMSVEEVKARRDQLRMARDLMFREEAKSKRIKKIKSKSYRKVHRKQREKEERKNQQELADGGYEPSEDELEAQDRRRATERMGAKHRGSKWAKATKQIGRAAWDEDARDGITEMARRDEELRKRVEGRAVRKEFEDNSDASFSDSDEELSEDDDDAEQNRLLRQLNKVSGSELVDESQPGGKLASMKFMRKAEEARKKQNDAMVEDIRRELAGEELQSEEEEQGDIGRRVFGPASTKSQEKPKAPKPDEFEEPEGSDEDNMDLEIHGVDNAPKDTFKPSRKQSNGSSFQKSGLSISKSQPEAPTIGGTWSSAPLKTTGVSETEAKRRRHKKNAALDIGELDLSQAALFETQASKPKKTSKKTSTTLEIASDSDSDSNSVKLPFAIRDQELVKRAFAGADVVGEFEAEKRQTIEDEDDKVVDNTLPGWGAWTGDGVSKREKARNKGRFLTKVEGIKEAHRKDAKLDKVIINEKRVKKVRIFPGNLKEIRGERMEANVVIEWQVSCIEPSSSV